MGVILVVVAHSDDQILGPGGTLVKYAQEGHEVKTIIFSYGELSHPHFKKDVIRKVRVEESEKADKLIGGSGVEFLGLAEGKFLEEKKDAIDVLLSRIEEYKPEKIFTHAEDENHPDHVAVYNILLEAYDTYFKRNGHAIPVYSFGIWRLFRLKARAKPKLVVDISSTFSKKLEGIELFKSQRVALLVLKWSIYLKAFITGMRNEIQFGEVFYKIR